MNPVSKDMMDILVADNVGVAGTPATDVFGMFIGTEPVKPYKSITLYDTGGRTPDYTFNNSIAPLRHETVQIRVRSQDYVTTYQKMRDVINALGQIGIFDVSVSGQKRVNYKNIFQDDEPLWLSKDDSEGYIYVCSFRAIREEKELVT